ncbi:MAG: hypothetical protein AAB388_02570 [Patescibacteria group bacterium]
MPNPPSLTPSSPPTSFDALVLLILDLINLVIIAIFAVLLVFIFWKIIDAWVINAADETKREEGKRLVVTAVLVLVVMISVWGIVEMIKVTFFG